MMIGNKAGPDTPPPPEEEPDHPAPLLSWIFYILAVLTIIGAAVSLGEGEGAYAFGGLVGAILWYAIGNYLHRQSARQAQMVELMRERNRRP